MLENRYYTEVSVNHILILLINQYVNYLLMVNNYG